MSREIVKGCNDCGESVTVVRDSAGHWLPFESDPDSAGTYAFEYDGDDVTARKVGGGYTGDRYQLHRCVDRQERARG